MKKFKEILLLKNLNRVGNSAINGKYNKILTQSEDIDDLISKMLEFETKFSPEDLEDAKSKAEETFERVNACDVEVITVFDDNYPEKLNVMKNAKPAFLYVKGNLEALNNPNIAVIGTRNPSESSQEFEVDFVKNILNTTDNVIVSGLALGCDRIAQQTTVDENKITIAVLPSFVEEITPASNNELAQSILENNGCLISEYNPGTKVYKSNYVNRDKIVAALSDSILVIECGVKSGTMHTVKAADKFQKQIFAYLPGERPEDTYDGNEFILENYPSSIKIGQVDDFFNNSKTKTNVQTTLF